MTGPKPTFVTVIVAATGLTQKQSDKMADTIVSAVALPLENL